MITKQRLLAGVNEMMKSLFLEYKRKKSKIKDRLAEFNSLWKRSDKTIFRELCFCICTPQSKAVLCDESIRKMEKNGILFKGTPRELKAGLKGVRFYNNKARYISAARELFTVSGRIRIKDKIDPGDIGATRFWFQEQVKGIGPKEASHFLRNIGFGKNLAILDVHVLRNMVKYGIIKEIPGAMTKKVYLDLEKKLAKFSRKIKIPMAELDLLFWSHETGQIFR